MLPTLACLDAKLFAGHSLRAGFLTSAAGKGASIFKMMDVSRHKSVDTLRGYVRDAELFKDHAGAGCCERVTTCPAKWSGQTCYNGTIGLSSHREDSPVSSSRRKLS